MSPTLRCPHCGHRFSLVTVPEPLACPACSKPVPAPRAATAAPAAKAAAASPAAPVALKKRCPACDQQYPADQSRCPACGASYTAARIEKNNPEDGDGFGPERKGVAAGVVGGIVMIVIAALWFFGGLAAGYIFYYPPILALIGVYAVFKGLATGNYAGEKASPRRRRAR